MRRLCDVFHVDRTINPEAPQRVLSPPLMGATDRPWRSSALLYMSGYDFTKHRPQIPRPIKIIHVTRLLVGLDAVRN